MPKVAGSLVRYPARVTSVWFAAMIVVGTAALLTPWASRPGREPISVLDAAFTATSALCVTGLSVRSTIDDFSPIGQLIILLLIQLGGIGIMTLTTFVLMSLGGQSGLRHRAVISETLGAGENADVKSILRRVLSTTAVIEGTGILILWIRFMFEFPWLKALWYAVFHTVSAFCNAGFALWNDSLTRYQYDPVINITISILIILGGIGFPVLLDVWSRLSWSKPFSWVELHIHSKVTILGTLALLLIGFVSFVVLEWDNAIAEAPWYGKIFIPFFHSVSCRTAGFNSIDLNDLTNASLFISILLMCIGAGPCSTAGGIKVSTVSLLVMQAVRRFQGKSHVSFFRRTIPQSALDRAMASMVVFISIAVLACCLLMMIEQSGQSHRSQRDSFLEVLFEVTSALGTVGLSTGITPQLTSVGKCVILLLMFIGRVGPVSVMAALSRTTRESKVQYASEEPLIG